MSWHSPLDAPLEVIKGVIPSKSNGYRIARNRLYKTDAVIAFEKSFALQCRYYKNEGISTPFAFDIDVYYPSMRSDLDGVFKLTLDVLQGIGAITNDNLCMQITARKLIDKDNPRIEFRIKAI